MERPNGVGVILVTLLFILCTGLLATQRGWAEERYAVKPGDTLFSISKSFGVSIEDLKRTNHLSKRPLKAKEVLILPRAKEPRVSVKEKPRTWTVKKGDTLAGIARRTGVSAGQIKALNQLQSSALKPGRQLALRAPASSDVEVAPPPVQEYSPAQGQGEVGESDVLTADTGNEPTPEPLPKWSSCEERNLFVKVVKNFLGVPYSLGGSTLRGIDCSAFVKKIYEIFNTTLPRTVREQFRAGKSVCENELQEGDLVFFNAPRVNISHVGIYIGNKLFVHASSREREVKVDSLDMPYFRIHFLRGVRVRELEM
jgi:peptidoglycan DL-endopeptidase LytE